MSLKNTLDTKHYLNSINNIYEFDYITFLEQVFNYVSQKARNFEQIEVNPFEKWIIRDIIEGKFYKSHVYKQLINTTLFILN